jgi:hypothetical protein
MFRRIAASTHSGLSAASTAGSRRSFGALSQPTDASNPKVREQLIRKHDQTYFLPGIAVVGGAYFGLLWCIEKGNETHTKGLHGPPKRIAGWTLWRSKNYTQPAVHKAE